jgi:hypothetical protein
MTASSCYSLDNITLMNGYSTENTGGDIYGINSKS